ncbi:MAG: hypothetical protein HZC38_14380 [Chloroflexi bacterium]|nr:hypothetical protein [Chloroflexota bacterium]MBI5348287.1 hypothetical protein [Chloroflexota bacterium]MBI5714585.1 hypothetical protein [Chloroflexota bacterium]
MKRPLIFLRNIFLILVWLAVMLTPCFAITLAMRGEMEWKRGDYESDRLWLIQERDQRGVGYAASRITTDQRSTGGPLCVRTSARFFLWKGVSDGDFSDWCECYGVDKTVTTSCK